jgi:predicted nucleic acid-binding protein
MIRYALDTSILLRWFSQMSDPDTERALRLRAEHLGETIELVVLDQSVYELIHVLKESAFFDQEQISEALASLEYMHIQIVPYSHEITRKAGQIACEHDISIYAACFIALGAHLRCQAVTCDENLYRKVASLPWTILLTDLNL